VRQFLGDDHSAAEYDAMVAVVAGSSRHVTKMCDTYFLHLSLACHVCMLFIFSFPILPVIVISYYEDNQCINAYFSLFIACSDVMKQWKKMWSGRLMAESGFSIQDR
jgi:hypothetical protein